MVFWVGILHPPICHGIQTLHSLCCFLIERRSSQCLSLHYEAVAMKRSEMLFCFGNATPEVQATTAMGYEFMAAELWSADLQAHLSWKCDKATLTALYFQTGPQGNITVPESDTRNSIEGCHPMTLACSLARSVHRLVTASPCNLIRAPVYTRQCLRKGERVAW